MRSKWFGSVLGLPLLAALVGVMLISTGCGGPGGDPPKSTTSGPAIASVAPSSGPAAGGTTITINGTGFQSGANVNVGGVAATGVVFVSGGQLTAVTPAHAVGTVDVQVRNPGRGGNVTLSSSFTYTGTGGSGISLSSMSPTFGPPGGGTAVTINGSGIQSGASVTFGGTPATNVALISSSQITCVAPAHAAGAVDVKVTNPDASSATLFGFYDYRGISVTSVSPNQGRLSGGITVTITGASFAVGASVRFGGVLAPSVTFSNSTTLTAVTPAHAAGFVDVEVLNPDNVSGVLPSGYNYQAIAVNAVNPTGGPAAGGTALTISGMGFQSGATVRLGTVAATQVTLVNANQLTAVSPANVVGPVDLQVVNLDLEPGLLSGAFTYEAAKSFSTAPVISSITPGSGPKTGGTPVTIAGTNFQVGAAVLFDAIAATAVNVVSGSQITALTPNHPAGFSTVKVSNPSGEVAAAGDAFRFDGLSLQSVSPTAADTGGGSLINLTGTDFVAASVVKFDGINALSTTLIDNIHLQSMAPAHAAATVDVQVTNPDGQSATLAQSLTYLPPPTITRLSRQAGSTAGGTLVTIIGTTFASGAVVNFGGVASPSVTFVSSNELRAVAPAHAKGVVDVEIVNPNGNRFLAGAAFTFEPAPTTFYIPNQSFEDGTRGVFGTDTGATSVVSVIEAAHTGARSIKARTINTGFGGAARLTFRYTAPSNPPITDPNGLYQRWYMMFPQSTLDRVRNTATCAAFNRGTPCGQIKIHLGRSLDGGQTEQDAGWLMMGLGAEFNCEAHTLGLFRDYFVAFLPGTCTQVVLQANRWYEIQSLYKESADGSGQVKVWIDGELKMNTSDSILGSPNPALFLDHFLGIAYTQSTNEELIMYIDDAASANGFIEPTP